MSIGIFACGALSKIALAARKLSFDRRVLEILSRIFLRNFHSAIALQGDSQTRSGIIKLNRAMLLPAFGCFIGVRSPPFCGRAAWLTPGARRIDKSLGGRHFLQTSMEVFLNSRLSGTASQFQNCSDFLVDETVAKPSAVSRRTPFAGRPNFPSLTCSPTALP